MEIEELKEEISAKDRIIAEKDSLLSDPDGDQKVTFDRYQEVESVTLHKDQTSYHYNLSGGRVRR